MRTGDPIHKVEEVLLLVWAILCILFFISIPGKVSYVQWSNLDSWHLLGAKLERLDPASDLVNLIWSFGRMVIFSLVCTGLGAYVSGKMRIRSQTNSPSTLMMLALLATEFTIGNGLFSLILLALAGLYKITAAYIVLLLAIGSLLGAKQLQNNIQKVLSGIASRSKQLSENRWSRMILILSSAILCLSILYSTARISYDSSAIYFSDAKLTALNDHLQFFVDDNFIVSAFHSSIQYTAMIKLFGDQSARMFSWFSGIIFIVFSIALGERVGVSRQGRILLLTLLLTSTAFLDLMGDGKIDIQSSVPAIAAVYWMAVDGQNKTPAKHLAFLIGFLLGLAVIARPFNAFLVTLFAGLFYGQRIFIRKGFQALDYRSFLHSMLYMSAGAIGWGIYHLFANWIVHGDPLAFFSSIAKINASGGPWDYNPDTILAARLLYPFIITFYNTPQTLGNISPLFIAFLPTLLIQDIRKKLRLSKQLSVLLITALVTLLLWIFLFFTVYEIRYVFFLWAILFMPVAEAIATVLENEKHRFQNVLGALIIGILAFTIVRVIYISVDTYSPIDAQGNPKCRDSRFCEYLTSINQAAAPGDRVLTLGAFRYYLRNDLFACSARSTEYKTLQELTSQNPEAFWEEVYRQGYKYVAYENDYTTRHLQFAIIPSPSNTPEWMKLEPIFGVPGDLQVAYKINVSNPPVEVEATCQKDSAKGWGIRPPVP